MKDRQWYDAERSEDGVIIYEDVNDIAIMEPKRSGPNFSWADIQHIRFMNAEKWMNTNS